MKKAEKIIEGAVLSTLQLEKNLEEARTELEANDTFRKFLELEKQVKEQSAKVWKQIEEQMIAHDVKSIKGDWGYITLAERLGWETDDTLPNKFYKKVVDTTRLSATYRLEGKAPRGAFPKTTKYLTKKINLTEEK